MIRVNLGERSYDIAVTGADPEGLGQFVRQRARGSSAFIVTDENVARHTQAVIQSLAQAGFRIGSATLPAGEMQKSLAAASRLYDALADHQAERGTLIVAVGGGVIGDLAGFVAATYTRGLPLLMIPTTLLAMVDSSVGGKVGINHPKGKNLIGAFHQPVGVWIDTAMLATLPERDYRSGLAEVVKYGVILDAELFAYLEANVEPILQREPQTIRNIVARCCRLKADIVEQDEREETGRRALLNYGHTFAHAFEIVAGYGEWLHGEAVAVGMICASRLAERQGLIAPEATERQKALLTRFGLPTARPPWPTPQLLQAMRQDKKARSGTLRFILPSRLGEAALHDQVPEAEVQRVLDDSVA